MTPEAPSLRDRRELLVARSALQRLELAQELGVIRDSMRGPRVALALGGVALGVAGLGRMGRAIRAAALGVALLKLLRLFRR